MKAHCLPFSRIPHTTQLFRDFIAYSPAVQPFYPHSPYLTEWIKPEAAALKYGSQTRLQVSEILERQNRSFGASATTLANIEKLRGGAAAVVTGQQVGLFGGPMFAFYKAMSAVKLAREAAGAGVNAVPVFWLATYDHDLAEVNHVSIPGADGVLRRLQISSHALTGAPVSDVRLGDEILPVVEEAADLLGESEVAQFLREAYRPGESMGTAFAKFYARLFAEWGVILLDASDPELHRLAAPVYRTAVEKAEELAAMLLARGRELEKVGYHQQVKVTESSVLLFVLQDGVRSPIHLVENAGAEATFVIGTGSRAEKLSRGELLQRIEEHPEVFSPNVLLRPIVQDFLLPTLVYLGGAAEIAYFGQAGVVYEAISGRVTPVVPRFSATLVEPKAQRWLHQYAVDVADVMQGEESLRKMLASRTLPPDLQAAFDRFDKNLDEGFAGLNAVLEKLDSTLIGAAETSASKVRHQLKGLRERALAAELRRSEVLTRHAEAMSHALYPEAALQERGVAGAFYVARYGMELLENIHDAVRSDCLDHQIMEL